MINVLFMGRKQVAANCLRYLAQRADVNVVGVLTDSHLAVSPTAEVAREFGFRIFDFDTALKHLEDGLLNFDLGLSMLYWRKLRGAYLLTPKLGIINFHPAPLPEFKGTAGYNLAILEECNSWATTAHYVDESIDTGSIIEVSHFPISPETETAKSLECLSQIKLENQFVRVVECALTEKKPLPSYSNVGGRYFSRADMEAMKEVKLGDDVAKKIRAFWFPPYDGAYMIVGGVKCTLVNNFILNQLADQFSSSLFTSKAVN